MNDVARCTACGIRFDAQRDRCPRCGCLQPPVVVVNGGDGTVVLSALVSPHRLATAGMIAGTAIALAAAVMWAGAGQATTVAAPVTPSPLARLFEKEAPHRMVATPRVPADVPFVDAAAGGREKYDAGDFEAALAQFREQMDRDPDDAEARSNAGQVLIRLGRTTEALPLLQEAADLDASRWAYRFNLARAQGLLGRWPNAAEDYAKAAKLFPTDYATLFNLAQALHRSGREAEAVAQYHLAIEQKPDDPAFHLALGISEESLGHAAEAAAAYRRSVALDPFAQQAPALTARAQQLEASAARALPRAADGAPGSGGI